MEDDSSRPDKKRRRALMHGSASEITPVRICSGPTFLLLGLLVLARTKGRMIATCTPAWNAPLTFGARRVSLGREPAVPGLQRSHTHISASIRTQRTSLIAFAGKRFALMLVNDRCCTRKYKSTSMAACTFQIVAGHARQQPQLTFPGATVKSSRS